MRDDDTAIENSPLVIFMNPNYEISVQSNRRNKITSHHLPFNLIFFFFFYEPKI